MTLKLNKQLSDEELKEVKKEKLESLFYTTAKDINKSFKLDFKKTSNEILQGIEILKPRERITASEFALKHIKGAKNVPFRLDKCAYMRDIIDLLDSREYTEIIVLGSARSGKTYALTAGLIYKLTYKQQSAILYHLTESKADDYAKQEFQPILKRDEFISSQLVEPYNLKEYQFKSGNFFWLRFPTINHFASVTVQNVFITDFDRWKDDFDGEGNGFELARTRTTTFKNEAMTLVESSPKGEVLNPDDKIRGHLAPDAVGITSLYNTGDRRCYYYKCLNCHQWFRAEPSVIWFDETLETLDEKAKSTRVKCPHCSHKYTNHENQTKLIPCGKWLRDGEQIDKNDIITGDPIVKGKRASFWQQPPAAGFITLEEVTRRRLMAEAIYNDTGNEANLKSFYNVTLGEPYKPKNSKSEQVDDWEDHKDETIKLGECPENTRLLIGTVDVQAKNGGYFVVQMIALTDTNAIYLVDRFKINSHRNAEIKPAVNADDWDAITEKVLNYRAKIQNNPNFFLAPAAVLIDSGGLSETTHNAKHYLNKMNSLGFGDKVILIKGEASRGREEIARMSKNHDFKGKFLLINSNAAKLELYGRLKKVKNEKYPIIFPIDTPDFVFRELTAEVFNSKKGYFEKTNKARNNEALDLFAYFLAYIKFFKIDQMLNLNERLPSFLLPVEHGNSNRIEIGSTDDLEAVNRQNRSRFTLLDEQRHKNQIKNKFLKSWRF